VEAGRRELVSGGYGGGKMNCARLDRAQCEGGVALGCRVEEGKGGLVRRGVKEGGGSGRWQDPGAVA
jgi:hypothetical protein